MKGIFIFFISVLGLILITSCSNEPEKIVSEIKPGFKFFQDSLYTNYKEDVLNKNESLLNTLFDDVAYNSLDLVLTDRAYKSKPNEAPKLKEVPLRKMKSKIKGKGDNDSLIRNYITKFVDLKNRFQKKELSKKSVFIDETNAITKSEVYLNDILKDKTEDSLYTDLTSRIERLIKTTQGKYETIRTKNKWLTKQGSVLQERFKIQQEKKNVQGSSSILKEYSSVLLVLLILSLLTNIILGLLFLRQRKKRKKTKNKESEAILEKEQKQALPSSLTKQEVDNYISQTFKKLQTNLTAKYHPDCVETEIPALKSFELNVSEKSKSQQFADQQALEQFVSPLAQKHYGQIVQKVEKILDQHSVREAMEQELNTENFVLKYSSSIISNEEIRSKVTSLKKRYYDEMPKVISKNDRNILSEDLRESIKIALEKMIKENSQLYFPYADAQGVLYDDKRSKEKERDSALKLTLNPHDNTRATFQLLYEYSDMMQAGIQSYDILLLPICDLKSEDFNRNGTKISQNGNDGEMILEDAKWKLHTKLAIKIT